jgi:heptosyltransferase I
MLDGQRIAIVLLSAIGDVVHALPLVSSLGAAALRARIEWIIQPIPAELIRHHPSVARVWLFERRRSWRAYRDFRRDIRNERFDLAIDLQVYAKASLLTAMLDAERKIGFDRARARELNWLATSERIPSRPAAHVMDQYLEFADYLGVERSYSWPLPLSPDERAQQIAFYRELGAPAAVLVLGTSKREKEWPAERWARFAEALHDGWGYEVLIAGGAAPVERELARQVMALARCPVRDEQRDDLRRLLWLLDGAAVVVSPDTGPYHMAVALGAPAVGLYGYTDPARVGPAYRFLDLVVDAWHAPGEPWHPPASGYRAGPIATIGVETVLEKIELARARYPRARNGPGLADRPSG